MPLLVRGKSLLRNPTLGRAKFIEGGLCAPVVPAVLTRKVGALIEARFELTGVVISMLAANDYGGVQLADLPNTSMLIAGGIIDAVGTMAGFASNVATGLTYGLGSATASNATLATTMQDFVNIATAAGAGATATLKKHSFANGSPALIFKAASASNDIFLNAACPVTTGTGTLTFTSGYASLFYFDLGATS